jgi:hypothetical protein
MDDMADDNDSLTYYSADDLDLDVCGDPFDPSDHFFDSKESIEQLCSHSEEGFDVASLNEHVFPKSRYDNEKYDRHEPTLFSTNDGDSYGWMTAMSSLIQSTSIPKPISRYIRSIHSGTRREILSMKRRIHYAGKHDVAAHQSSNELDSHANTCCLGKNFVPLYYTGEVCNVHAYSDELEAIKDVQIGTGATLWTDSNTGSRYILESHQALMFTDLLEHSLLNPNQIRYEGHSLCNDPWDKHRSLGLMCCDNPVCIPFETRGTVIHFDSSIPTADELHTLPRIVLTDDRLWNPSTVSL